MRNWYQRLMRRQAFHPGPPAVVLNSLYFVRRGLARAVRRHAPAMHGVLLDFGCGSQPYRHFFMVRRYIAIDVDLGGHPHTGEPVDVWFDGRLVPLASESVDSVLASEVFEHVFSLDAVLREIHRVLKPGGRLLATCPFVWNEHEAPFDVARYTRFGLRDRFERAGFRVVSESKEGHFVHALAQLGLLYCVSHLRPHLPVVGRLVEFLWSGLLNSMGLALGVLLPQRWDFHLTNVFLVEKSPRIGVALRDSTEPPGRAADQPRAVPG